jgi:hypothetical protein
LQISCLLPQDGEWIVLVVDVLAKDRVTIVHSSDSVLTADMNTLAATFGKHVRQAFLNCSGNAPISESETPTISAISNHGRRKDSAFGCMVCIEQFCGKELSKVMHVSVLQKFYFLLQLYILLLESPFISICRWILLDARHQSWFTFFCMNRILQSGLKRLKI